MAEKDNKNNEYNISYNGSFFNDFPDFDSIPTEPVRAKEEEKSEKKFESVPKEKSVIKEDEPLDTKISEAPEQETPKEILPEAEVSEAKVSVTEIQQPEINEPKGTKAEVSDLEIEEPVQIENSTNQAHSLKTSTGTKNKKNIIFAAICAALAVGIIACSTLSVFSINKFLNSPVASPVISDDNSYNEYADMVAKFDTTKYPAGILPNLTKAYAINNDVVGWLYIKGTNINTPVVQSKSNEYYLRNNFYKSYTKYGTTYAEYRCKRTELSKNMVIFGHNMPSGTHFYDVNRYEDIEWYKKNPIITYSSLNGTYTYLIYTAFYSTVLGKDDGGYVFNYIHPNMSEASFKGYIEQVNQRALYKTSVDLKSTDKIITLSTCNHTYDSMCGKDVDSRLVVIGRLLRDGESADVNVSAAKENPGYRKPQTWYNLKGKTNPYASSRSWQPTSK